MSSVSSSVGSPQQSAPKAPPPPVDIGNEEAVEDYKPGGYHPIRLGDGLGEAMDYRGHYTWRYYIVRKLGWGHFSTVWLVKDEVADRHVAMKIVRAGPKYSAGAMDEIAMLRKVSAGGRRRPNHPGRNHLVEFLDSFDHPSNYTTLHPNIHASRFPSIAPLRHVCITFEPLGESLLSLLRRPEYFKKGIPLPLVKQIAKQLLLGLDFLHHECALIHTDLKPENVLVAIDDVEALVNSVLATEPESQSVAVDAAPVRGSSRRPKKVHIFGSQPLPSPTHTLIAMHMTQVSKSAQPPSVLPSASVSKSTSSSNTDSPVTLSTAPTSLSASMMAAHITQPQDKDANDIGDKCPIEHQMHEQPSLLSQTRNLPLPALSESVSSTGTSTPLACNDIGSQNVTPVPPAPTPLPSDGLVASALEDVTLVPTYPRIRIKIADLGNATSVRAHVTNDIQTRQYRCPEVILGREDWDQGVDVWSAACLIFELLTADYLFAPQQGKTFNKDDDHMAQIIELMGDIPRRVKYGGKHSRQIFRSNGRLRNIEALRLWNVKDVLKDKYELDEFTAREVQLFLEPMLNCEPRDRATTRELLRHSWLDEALSGT